MRKYYIQASLASFFVVFLLFSPNFSFAAEPNIPTGAFVVRPAKVELSLVPGGTITKTLTLSNGTALPLAVDVSFEDIAPQEQTTAVDDPIHLLGADVGTYSLKDLISTKERSLTILSGQTIELPVAIHIPNTAIPEGHYGSVVLAFKPIFSSDHARDESVAVESRLATLFYVRIEGATNESGKLVQFGLFNDARTTYSPKSEKPLRFQIAYENTGNVHLNPYGRLTLTSFLGKASVVTIDPWAVLPGGVRMREIDIQQPLSVGYYTALLEQNRGYQDIIDTQTVHFWVIPTAGQDIFIILVLILLFFVIRRSLSISKHFVS